MSDKPHFAIIGSRGYPSTYGGFETLVRRLAPYLATKAHVSVYGRSPVKRATTAWQGAVQTVDTRGVDSQSLSTLTYGLTACLDARRRSYDAALVLNVANGYFLPMLKRAGVPTALNVDGIEWERDKWSRVGKLVFRGGARLSAHYASHLIVDSEAIGAYWSDRFGVSSTFIPYGADVLTRQSSDRLREVGVESGSYLLVVARLVPENNVSLFLDALGRLGRRYPAVVVGSAGKPGSAIEARLASAAETGDVHWLGHVSDQELLAQLWGNCGAYVHGHSVGGTNPALLQAMGAGSPTLALDTPYNREVLREGGGRLFNDIESLIESIDLVMNDASLRDKLRADAQRVIGSRYSWSQVLDGYHQVLERARKSAIV